MKPSTIILIIFILAFGVALFFVGRSTVDVPEAIDNSKEIEKLENQIRISKLREDSLKTVLAELKKEKETTVINTQQDITEIDIEIEKDSSNSIKQFRDNLFLLDVMPDNGDYITHREAGFGAKFFRELKGKRIELSIADKIIEQQAEFIKEKDIQIKNKEGLIFYSNQATDYYKEKYEDTQSLLYDRFIVYFGVGINYLKDKIEPGIQAGIGIKIAGNK